MVRPHDCESWGQAVALEMSNEGKSVETAQGFQDKHTEVHHGGQQNLALMHPGDAKCFSIFSDE